MSEWERNECHKVEEYKNKLEHNWRSSKPDL